MKTRRKSGVRTPLFFILCFGFVGFASHGESCPSLAVHPENSAVRAEPLRANSCGICFRDGKWKGSGSGAGASFPSLWPGGHDGQPDAFAWTDALANLGNHCE